jgi:hypothetical protein
MLPEQASQNSWPGSASSAWHSISLGRKIPWGVTIPRKRHLKLLFISYSTSAEQQGRLQSSYKGQNRRWETRCPGWQLYSDLIQGFMRWTIFRRPNETGRQATRIHGGS